MFVRKLFDQWVSRSAIACATRKLSKPQFECHPERNPSQRNDVVVSLVPSARILFRSERGKSLLKSRRSSCMDGS